MVNDVNSDLFYFLVQVSNSSLIYNQLMSLSFLKYVYGKKVDIILHNKLLIHRPLADVHIILNV